MILALNHPSKFTSFAWYEWWPPTRSILFCLHELSFTLHTCTCIDTVAKGIAASAVINKCFGTFTALSLSLPHKYFCAAQTLTSKVYVHDIALRSRLRSPASDAAVRVGRCGPARVATFLVLYK